MVLPINDVCMVTTCFDATKTSKIVACQPPLLTHNSALCCTITVQYGLDISLIILVWEYKKKPSARSGSVANCFRFKPLSLAVHVRLHS